MTLGLLVLALFGPAMAHAPITFEIDPTEDWCQVIADAQNGDLFLFYPGVYEGPCHVYGVVPDNPGEVLVIRSFQDFDPAVFVPGPTGDHVFSVTGQAVNFENVAFEGIVPGTAAIEVEGHNVVVSEVSFRQVAGVGVRQVGNLDRLEVVSSVFDHTDGVGIQLGCIGCSATDMRLHDNLVVGADTGFIATQGAWGYVRDNAISASEAGVLWTGHASEDSAIEENLVEGPVDSVRAIGGQVTVRNNVLLAPGLSQGPGVHRWFGNTVDAGDAPVRFDGWTDGAGVDARNNALSGDLAVPSGGVDAGNVVCTERCACWLGADERDFYPSPGGPLRTDGVEQAFGELTADWCGNPRPDVPTVGAFQGVSLLGPGPLELALRDTTTCLYPPDPAQPPDPCGTGGPSDSGLPATGTGTGTGTGGSKGGGGGPRQPGGCGCAHTGQGGGPAFLAWVVAIGLIRRRI